MLCLLGISMTQKNPSKGEPHDERRATNLHTLRYMTNMYVKTEHFVLCVHANRNTVLTSN